MEIPQEMFDKLLEALDGMNTPEMNIHIKTARMSRIIIAEFLKSNSDQTDTTFNQIMEKLLDAANKPDHSYHAITAIHYHMSSLLVEAQEWVSNLKKENEQLRKTLAMVD